MSKLIPLIPFMLLLYLRWGGKGLCHKSGGLQLGQLRPFLRPLRSGYRSLLSCRNTDVFWLLTGDHSEWTRPTKRPSEYLRRGPRKAGITESRKQASLLVYGFSKSQASFPIGASQGTGGIPPPEACSMLSTRTLYSLSALFAIGISRHHRRRAWRWCSRSAIAHQITCDRPVGSRFQLCLCKVVP